MIFASSISFLTGSLKESGINRQFPREREREREREKREASSKDEEEGGNVNFQRAGRKRKE
jgi:hypothetical protein